MLQSASSAEAPEELLEFVKRLREFPFFDDIKSVLSQAGISMEKEFGKGDFRNIVEAILSSRGLNFADQPKALIPFHRYAERNRTALEEHLVEAKDYALDSGNVARIHFTISPEHETAVRQYFEKIRALYEKDGTRFEINFSVQANFTDTIAVDMHNEPFRDAAGKLVFRPAGHGALLENLNTLQGDIVFIKNIDNVVPDALKATTYFYKRILGGLLVEKQNRIFNYLRQMEKSEVSAGTLDEILKFTKENLGIGVEKTVENKRDLTAFLFSKLNRPIRVCGMVKNQGEPGGGPFWVRSKGGTIILQIVEQAQVNVNLLEQKGIWNASTHFNPVDLVCGLKDYRGGKFDLKKFCDPESGLIAIKSKDGRSLKALELPGLWNGGMADWITIFVEVPLITFNPVKTVNDLLRKEHQFTG
jgi:hypothetical protein